MALTASSKLALKRGALITAANWQVVVLQFVADALFTALLAVPVVGGAALVVLTSGLAPRELFDQGVRLRFRSGHREGPSCRIDENLSENVTRSNLSLWP